MGKIGRIEPNQLFGKSNIFFSYGIQLFPPHLFLLIKLGYLEALARLLFCSSRTSAHFGGLGGVAGSCIDMKNVEQFSLAETLRKSFCLVLTQKKTLLFFSLSLCLAEGMTLTVAKPFSLRAAFGMCGWRKREKDFFPVSQVFEALGWKGKFRLALVFLRALYSRKDRISSWDRNGHDRSYSLRKNEAISHMDRFWFLR